MVHWWELVGKVEVLFSDFKLIGLSEQGSCPVRLCLVGGPKTQFRKRLFVPIISSHLYIIFLTIEAMGLQCIQSCIFPCKFYLFIDLFHFVLINFTFACVLFLHI